MYWVAEMIEFVLTNAEKIDSAAVDRGGAVTVTYRTKAGQREEKRIRHPKKWVSMARDVRGYCEQNETSYKEFFQSRYDMCEEWRDACKRLGISKDTYYAMRADVLRMGELYAVYRGAVAPMDCRI